MEFYVFLAFSLFGFVSMHSICDEVCLINYRAKSDMSLDPYCPLDAKLQPLYAVPSAHQTL